MGKVKIVFITEDIFGESIGGVEQHIYHVGIQLARLGKEVIILSLQAGRIDTRKEEIIFEDKGTVTTIKIVKKNFLIRLFEYLEKKVPGSLGMFVAFMGKLLPNVYFRTLLKEVRKLSPDIVHQHDYLASIVASKVISKSIPVVFTNHTGQYLFLEKNKFSRYIQSKLISHYSAVIGPSIELTPNDERSHYISNGVDLDFFSGEKSDYLLGDRVVFICPRRWAPTKGVKYFAEALTLISDDYKDKVFVLFAGSDSDDYPWYRDQVLELLQDLPSGMYSLLGNLSQADLRDSFLKSDVVVIPSLMEATSLAAMEGMACGLPVLSTDVGGMPSVVKDGLTGWMVPPENSGAIAKMITMIVDKNFCLETMGENAASFVRENKSWVSIAAEVSDIYENIEF